MGTSTMRWGDATTRPPRQAFHVEWVIDPFTGEPAIGMVRHPGHCYREMASKPGRRDSLAWHAIGRRYLEALAAALDLEAGVGGWLHAEVWKALEPRSARERPGGFGWLDITWSDKVSTEQPALPRGVDPVGSYWVDLEDTKSQARTLVLLAGSASQPHARHNGLQLGSDVGLRIAIDARKDELLIRGVALSGLSGRRALEAAPAWAREGKETLFANVSAMHAPIRQALHCGVVRFSNLEVAHGAAPDPRRVRASGHALRWATDGADPSPKPAPNRAHVRDFCVDLVGDASSHAWRVEHIVRDDFIGSAAAGEGWHEERVFAADAASQGPVSSLRQRRPTRSEAVLDRYRTPVAFSLPSEGALQFVDETAQFETRGARPRTIGVPTVATRQGGVVDVATSPRHDESGAPILMSDAAGSIETHARASELFARFVAYHIDAQMYFRFARLPLVQRARPAMRWAPQGELPNAEVRPFIGDRTADAADPGPRDRYQLLVKYGSADPLHRRRLRSASDPQRRRAQFLSVASDPRWAWHEFGHVLNFASTGELEFPFAHSAGDALAAIAGDPLSLLADDAEAPVRFATFPWIQVPGRSHGRSAAGGYCWCGQRNRLRLDFDGPLERYRHGYYQEQLLSSSLFRLYRSLGGDTRSPRQPDGSEDFGDALARLEASDYCIYLIMRAISLLGPDSIAPARTPDQFVSALIDADASTGAWQVDAAWPYDLRALIDSKRFGKALAEAPPPVDRSMRRRGGRVHKVIRWAFERQGLYAAEQPKQVVEGPGKAPAVDVYLADRRAGPDAQDGGYSPVPLRVDPNAGDAAASDMQWLADPRWLALDGRRVAVRVANRGADAAQGVSLRLWWSPRGAAFAWRSIVAGGATPASVPADQPGHETWLSLDLAEPLPAPGWLLIAADAPADPSNLRDEPPPPADPRELLELVAHDNNLALARL